MNGQCNCCGREKDLRFGACYDCSDSESLIESGMDMYDNPAPKIEGMSLSMSMLQHILRKYISIKTKPTKE